MRSTSSSAARITVGRWPPTASITRVSRSRKPRAKPPKVLVGPHHVWEKSPGLSGLAFYDGDRFKAWQHNAFIGALVTRELIRLQFDGDKVVHEERLLGELNKRIRDVRQGPDGYLYVLTDEEDGALYKIGLK